MMVHVGACIGHRTRDGTCASAASEIIAIFHIYGWYLC